MLDFEDFQKRWVPSVERICRDIYSENRERIAVKKEDVVVKNMMRILDAVFALSREKGFHAMTLRDLSRKSGLSMGALYSYLSSGSALRQEYHPGTGQGL